MFQFTTTTIINNNVDFTTNLPLWTSQAENTQDGTVGSFNIKRQLKFLKPNVTAIYKQAYSAPVLATATVDMASITQASGVFRIAMYIRLSDSQNSYYSNDFVFKGKPLYIEFQKNAGETGAQLAAKVAKIAKKYLVAVCEFQIIKVTATDTKVIITAVDEYQRFTKVDLEYFNESAGQNLMGGYTGEYQVIASAKVATDEEYDTKNTIVQGVEGFGTYQWVLKNLRLPTAANTRWTRIVQDEAPLLGAKYNQYTIEYCVNRDDYFLYRNTTK